MMDSQGDFESGSLPPAVQAAPDPLRTERPGRVHWVVVRTHRMNAPEVGEGAPTIQTRFWHPRDHRWSDNVFDSLDHALRLFVDESGWVLRQQQALDLPDAYELIFEARREDFSRPSTAEMLQDVGLTEEDVAKLLNRVDREGGTP
jgi:hypothetical protein